MLRSAQAAHGLCSETAGSVDYTAHAEAYRGFVRGVRLALAVTAITLILLAYFLL
ncbi:MAG: aa3-type cytochrome c oxidase subunit IV [Hyphomicrobium sp.]|jgi:hypothetical protein